MSKPERRLQAVYIFRHIDRFAKDCPPGHRLTKFFSPKEPTRPSSGLSSRFSLLRYFASDGRVSADAVVVAIDGVEPGLRIRISR